MNSSGIHKKFYMTHLNLNLLSLRGLQEDFMETKKYSILYIYM